MGECMEIDSLNSCACSMSLSNQQSSTPGETITSKRIKGAAKPDATDPLLDDYKQADPIMGLRGTCGLSPKWHPARLTNSVVTPSRAQKPHREGASSTGLGSQDLTPDAAEDKIESLPGMNNHAKEAMVLAMPSDQYPDSFSSQ